MNDELWSCVDVLKGLQCFSFRSLLIIWMTFPLVQHSEEVAHCVEYDELYNWEECVKHHSCRKCLTDIKEPLRVEVRIDSIEEVVYPGACVSTVPWRHDVEYTGVEELNVEHAVLDKVYLIGQNWLTDPEHKCDEK